MHKTANVLNKVPKSVQSAMKADLREIHGAPTRAAACLTKDRDALPVFYDMPAEHWDHLPTTNPIESVFATVRHRTVRTKGGACKRLRAASCVELQAEGRFRRPPPS